MTADRLATARHDLRQAQAWTPRNQFDQQAKDRVIAQLETYIAECEQDARSEHPAGGGR